MIVYRSPNWFHSGLNVLFFVSILLVSGQTIVDVMLHLIIKFKQSAFLSRRNQSFVSASRSCHQLRCNRRLKLLSINNGIEITLMHPSALLVKLVTVSSGEKEREREREIGKERQEEKNREKRRKIKGSICVFFVCVCFVSYSLPIFMTAQNEGERKCVLERQWARPGSRVQTSAIERDGLPHFVFLPEESGGGFVETLDFFTHAGDLAL